MINFFFTTQIQLKGYNNSLNFSSCLFSIARQGRNQTHDTNPFYTTISYKAEVSVGRKTVNKKGLYAVLYRLSLL